MKSATRHFRVIVWLLTLLLFAGHGDAAGQGKPGKTRGGKAGASDDDDLDEELKIKSIVHSATKSTTTVEEAPAVIHIITADDIAAFGYRHFIQALLQVPGILEASALYDSAPAWGVLGVVQGVLYLRDGLSMFGPVYNAPGMGRRIPMETIKRIEVMTSPGGVLWGANSFLGIVNVMTKRPEDIKGLEVGFGGGHGPGDEMVMRPYILFGKTFYKGKLGVMLHWSSEWFKGPRYNMPQLWLFTAAGSLSGPSYYRHPGGMDTLVPMSVYTQLDGLVVYSKPGTARKLELGWQLSLHKMPNLIKSAMEKRWIWWNGIHRPLGFFGTPERADSPRASLRHNRINLHDSYVYLRFRDQFAKDKVGFDARVYYTRFNRQFDPFVSLLESPGLLPGYAEKINAIGNRAGATFDFSWKIHKKFSLLWGGEVFFEWLYNAFANYVAPRDESGEIDLAIVGAHCPFEDVHGDGIPVYDPRNPANTTYVPNCRLPFIFNSDRLAYAAFLSGQFKPHKKVIIDGGIRLQHGPWGTAPHPVKFLYSGAVVWNFYKEYFLKANYATGFRPPVFGAVAGNQAGGFYGGHEGIVSEESQAVTGEFNATVAKNKKQVRLWNVRINYAYTVLKNMIRVVSGLYENSEAKALHSVGFSTDVYLKGGHRFALSYTYVRQHGSSYIDGGMFRSMPNHWASGAAVFSLLDRKNVKLDLNFTFNIQGAFEDPNKLLICPGGGNECTSRISDVAYDRIPPTAVLNLGARLRFKVAKKPVEFAANFYNALDGRRWTMDMFGDLNADVEQQPIPGPRFYFFLQAKAKLW